jgi:hypothetical protein
MTKPRYRLFHPHSVEISEPFLGHQTTYGLLVPFNDYLPRIYARVLQVHPSVTRVAPGDYITFPPHCYDRLLIDGDNTMYVMDERAILAIMEDWAA